MISLFNRRRLLFAATAVLSGCAAIERSDGQTALLRDRLETAIGAALERLSVVPGLSVAVVAPQTAYVGAFGVTNVETREPVTPDTAFYIASSTKSLTAMMLARLASRRQIDLEAPIAGLAPAGVFPASISPQSVRLRHLLTHTSGIENAPLAFRLAFTGQHDRKTLWALLAACEPNQQAPLGAYQYTNVGYNIATILTDHHLGVPWQDLMQREIFDPAGMSRSCARMSVAQAAGWSIAKPHWSATPEGARRIYLEKTDATMHSAGGVIMSAKDALRWLELLIEDGSIGGARIISPRSVQSTRVALAEINPHDPEYDAHHYGLGWFLSSYRNEPLVHHFGDFAGFSCHVSYMPHRRAGVAVFANDGAASYWLVHGVANFVYDTLMNRPDADAVLNEAVSAAARNRQERLQRIEADAAQRSGLTWLLSRPQTAYVGAYENERMGTIEIIERDGALNVSFGVLRARAEPWDQQDVIRAELIPNMPGLFAFEGRRAQPDALRFRNERYVRS